MIPKQHKKYWIINELLQLDLRSIGIFRIILGINLLFDLFYFRIASYKTFYSYDGLISLSEHISYRGSSGFSIFNFLTNDALVLLFFVACFVIYVLYTVGYKTKIISVLAYFCLWNLMQRWTYLGLGWQMYMNVLLFWSIFLPLNYRFSLFKTEYKKIKENIWWRLSVLAILLQIGLIYFGNAISKTGSVWMQGAAVESLLADNMLKHQTFSEILLSQKWLCSLLNYGTIIFELSIIFLIFMPFWNVKTRSLAALGIVIFHFSINLFADVGFFYLIAPAAAILLLPSEFWNRFTTTTQDEIILTGSQYHSIGHKILLLSGFLLMVNVNLHHYAQNSFVLEKILNKTQLSKVIEKTQIPWFEKSLFIRQQWSLFGPNPPDELGWIVIGVVDENNHSQYINISNDQFIDDSPPKNYFNGPMSYFMNWLKMKHKTMPFDLLLKEWLHQEAMEWQKTHPKIKVIEANINLYSFKRSDKTNKATYKKIYQINIK